MCIMPDANLDAKDENVWALSRRQWGNDGTKLLRVGEHGLVQGPSEIYPTTKLSVRFDPPAGLWDVYPYQLSRSKAEVCFCYSQ